MPASDVIPRLLKKAELPNEKECIGQIFAFTWVDQDEEMHRVIGRIDGLEGVADNGVGYEKLIIVTSSLRRRRCNSTNPPTISFAGEHDSFGNQRVSAKWWIYFDDLGPMEQSGPENPQIYDGTFRLL